MQLLAKLKILADAAKYDASCASSGSRRAPTPGGVGHSDGTGICHSYTPDGRCVSLLKILLTNYCIFECRYCVNRASSDVLRARFTPDEVIGLTERIAEIVIQHRDEAARQRPGAHRVFVSFRALPWIE